MLRRQQLDPERITIQSVVCCESQGRAATDCGRTAQTIHDTWDWRADDRNNAEVKSVVGERTWIDSLQGVVLRHNVRNYWLPGRQPAAEGSYRHDQSWTQDSRLGRGRHIQGRSRLRLLHWQLGYCCSFTRAYAARTPARDAAGVPGSVLASAGEEVAEALLTRSERPCSDSCNS